MEATKVSVVRLKTSTLSLKGRATYDVFPKTPRNAGLPASDNRVMMLLSITATVVTPVKPPRWEKIAADPRRPAAWARPVVFTVTIEQALHDDPKVAWEPNGSASTPTT